MDYLSQVLIVLFAAVFVVPLVQRLRWSPVLGYLVAGGVIGPYGFGLIVELEAVQALAELGVVFLLFAVGLELSIERLKVMGRYVFGYGTVQILVTGVAIGAVAWALGLGIPAAVVIGGGLALSSTAVVLQSLAERGELTTRFGRVSLSILLMQDLAVGPLLIVLSLLADKTGAAWSDVGFAAIKMVAVVGGILLIGRLALAPLFRHVAASHNLELFAGMALLVVLGASWLTHAAGLSLALGAFLAGLLLADSEFRHQVEADIHPFRGILLALFFMSVGMRIDTGLAVDNAGLVAVLVAALLAGKTLVVTGLGRGFGLSSGASLRLGLTLAEAGEFAFVLFGLAVVEGLLPAELGQMLLVTVAITLFLTPLLVAAGQKAAGRIDGESGTALDVLAEEAGHLRNHVLIFGFGRGGRTIATLLEAGDIPYLALDLAPHKVTEGRARGRNVYYGDASRWEVVRAAGADRARAAVVILNNLQSTRKTVDSLRDHFPRLPVFVRAHDVGQSLELERAGAHEVVPETLEASIQLAGSVLRHRGLSDDRIGALIEGYRRANPVRRMAEARAAEGVGEEGREGAETDESREGI